MGTIARQTIKGSIYSYIGAIIGFVNVVLLMPHIFSTAEVGLTNILISISAIFGQLGTLGFNKVTARLFPYFRNKENTHNSYFFLTVLVGLTGFALCVLVYYLIRPYLIKENIESSPLFVEYIYLLLPLIFISIFYMLIDTYNRVLFNASFGVFVKEFFLRILILIGIGLFYFNIFSFHDFIIYYTIVFAVPVLLIFILLFYRNEISFKPVFTPVFKGLKKEIYIVSMFGMISGFSGIAAMHIDRYMVNHFCDLGATGIYATAFFFGTMIILPGRSLYRIAATTITEAFKANDNKIIESIYKKSAVNQLIIASLIFLLIWGNIDNILKIMPEAYAQGKYVIFYISLAYLMQMGAGVSSEIIYLSKYYKVYSAIMLLLIIVIVVLNIIFIPVYGITGAALASFLSYLIYVLIKFIFIFYKFNFQPFNIKHLIILAVGVVSYLAAYIIPLTDILLLDLITKSGVIVIVFIVLIYLLKASDESNNIAKNIIDRILRKK